MADTGLAQAPAEAPFGNFHTIVMKMLKDGPGKSDLNSDVFYGVVKEDDGSVREYFYRDRDEGGSDGTDCKAVHVIYLANRFKEIHLLFGSGIL